MYVFNLSIISVCIWCLIVLLMHAYIVVAALEKIEAADIEIKERFDLSMVSAS